jgi:hypothetical protein
MADVKRRMLVIPLVLAVTVAWVTKVYAMGWLTMLLAVPYALVTVIHIMIHAMRLRLPGIMNNRELSLVLTSHCLLVGAFLVQWDAGDGLGWLTITALLGKGPGYPSSVPPRWWPRDAATTSILAFIPVVVTWVMIATSFRRQNNP